MRTNRHRSTLLAAATTAALALALTACGGDTSGTKSAGPADSSSAPAAAEGSSQDGGGAPADGTGTGTSKDTTAAQSTGTDSDSAGSAPTCTTQNVTISAARQDGPPYTHIVLTAKNTSGRSCVIEGFPKIQFLESHKEDVPAVAKSKPAAPVVLQAGAPAYAVVKLSDGGVDEENEPVSAFAVWLEGGDGMATVQAPGSGGIAVDPAVWATGYWTPELRDGADDF